MELKIKERFLSKNDVEPGTSERFLIENAEVKQKKSRKGVDYQVVCLRLKSNDGEIFQLEAFESELTAVICMQPETDTWKGHYVQVMHYVSSGNRSSWKISPDVQTVLIGAGESVRV